MTHARLLLAALLAAGLLALAPAAPSVAASATLVSTAPADQVIRNESFGLTGRLSTGFARTVRLQVLRGSRWVTLASRRTGVRGAFGFSGVRLSATRSYVVVAPAVRYRGKRYASTRTPRRVVHVVRQRVNVALLPQISQNSAALAAPRSARTAGYATLSPVRRGRAVVIEHLSGRRWVKVATATENRNGLAEFTLAGAAAGSYRARALPYRGAPARSSAARQTAWGAPALNETFTDPSRVDQSASSLWQTRGTSPSVSAHRTCSQGDPAMTSVDPAGAGRAVLSVQAVPGSGDCDWAYADGNHGTAPHSYLNAHIGTQGRFAFRYGVAAARVRFQRPTGMHGAFWLQVADRGITREIDTAEFFGEYFRDNPQGGLGTFVHAETKVGRLQPANLSWLAKGDSWWTRYHVFSVEWTPTRYAFRVDGRQIWTTTSGLSDRDEFLVLSLLTTDYELGRMPDKDLKDEPSMSVDWVRVWQDATVAGNRLTLAP